MILSLKNMTLYPIEVKKTANPNQSDSKNFNTLSVFKKTIGTGAIVCLYERAISIPNQNVVITPVWEI
jgi:hypothetical protein